MKYIYIIISIIVLLILVFLIRRKSQKKEFDNSIMVLYRQTARWAAAAIQDESELIALLHANYATGYLWALKDIVSSEDFKKITNVNFLEFENKIVDIQDSITKRVISKCPNLIFLTDKLLLDAMYSREPQ